MRIIRKCKQRKKQSEVLNPFLNGEKKQFEQNIDNFQQSSSNYNKITYGPFFFASNVIIVSKLYWTPDIGTSSF